MQVLFSVIHFDLLTGAAMHTYELARALADRGHDAVVASPAVGGELTTRAREHGVRVHALDALPSGLRPDVLHLNQAEPSLALLEGFPSVPAVLTCHSAGRADRPVGPDRVSTFIAVRPSLRERLVSLHGLPPERTTVVFNGIDLERFTPGGEPAAGSRPRVLFVGTVGELRREAALDIVARGERENFEVRFVGLRAADYLDDHPPHVSYLPEEVWHVEREIHQASATCGIFMGRTTIEGWACGRPAWIYDVDARGAIRRIDLHPPPPRALLDIFGIEHTTDRYEAIYANAVASRTA